MINYKQGEVVLILVAITSHITDRSTADDYRFTKQEQIACGLPKPSLIKLNKIVTLDKRLIRKSLGQLPQDTLEKVLVKIKQNF